jgi:hypothetical protein
LKHRLAAKQQPPKRLNLKNRSGFRQGMIVRDEFEKTLVGQSAEPSEQNC